jgi:CheY-like chemotaxis protein
MDIQMPELDGLEATRRIRAIPELAQVPIIAVTALAMPGDRERCLEAGANEYLSKPLRLRELAEVIERLMDKANEPG